MFRNKNKVDNNLYCFTMRNRSESIREVNNAREE